MTNRYSRQFSARCCNNNTMIIYTATIEAAERIMVEEINAALDAITSGFHEDIADALFERFGGLQVITAHHHGVDILTTRGPLRGDPRFSPSD